MSAMPGDGRDNRQETARNQNVLTRRAVIQGLASFAAAGFGLGGYAFAIEPYRLVTTRYAITPKNWPRGLHVRIAVIADLHVCEPWMNLARVERIVDHTNNLGADLIVLLGDYETRHRFVRASVPMRDWAQELGQLKAPLGVHAVLGNHDWWDDYGAQVRGGGPVAGRLALERAGVPVYENEAIRLVKGDKPFWLAGLGDQWAFYGHFGRQVAARQERRGRRSHHHYVGVDDLAGTLARITDDAPAILLAHEPDIFPEVPDRISLTLSGHTHGGQVQFFGYAPKVPSRYGQRYLYGHVVEEGRDLVVSCGLGCSGAPIRFGRPPEVVVVELGGDGTVA